MTRQRNWVAKLLGALFASAAALAGAPNFQSIFGSSTVVATAVDAAGNIYVAGSTTSLNFPVTPGAFQKTAIASVCGYLQEPHGTPVTPIPCSHGFVAKVDPTGTQLIYATYLGGEQQDGVNAIAVDSAGNAYVTGFTGSAKFPVTPGAWQTALLSGSFNGFVTKLTPDGSGLVFSTYLPGGQAAALAVDGAGNVFFGRNRLRAHVSHHAGSISDPAN